MQGLQKMDIFNISRPKLIAWAGEDSPVVVFDSPCSAANLTADLRQFIGERYLERFTCPGKKAQDVMIQEYSGEV